MEISDRGTVGLGGPVRNDRAIPEHSVTHFIDLIFNIGATKGDPTAGGTYGFGKSIAYMVSEVGAIVVWSRCATDRGPQRTDSSRPRSATYSSWTATAIPVATGGAEPWKVAPNRSLAPPHETSAGSQLFAKPFGDDELGTSILILAPEFGAPGPKDDAEVLTEAVLWNLWPKLLPDETGMHPMDIQGPGQRGRSPDPRPVEPSGAVGSGHLLERGTCRSIRGHSTPLPVRRRCRRDQALQRSARTFGNDQVSERRHFGSDAEPSGNADAERRRARCASD